MKSLNEYITEQQINEGFKDFLKNMYDIVTGKKRAERKRLEDEEKAQRKQQLADDKQKFLDAIGSGTKKYDLLSITYKYSDLSKKYWSGYRNQTGWTLVVLCDDNTLKNVETAYEANQWFSWLNGTNDEEKRKNGFNIIFEPWYENGKLLAKSFIDDNDWKNRSELIYMFDIEDVRLNNNKDIDDLINVLKNKPRDFHGGNIEGLIEKLESKKK